MQSLPRRDLQGKGKIFCAGHLLPLLGLVKSVVKLYHALVEVLANFSRTSLGNYTRLKHVKRHNPQTHIKAQITVIQVAQKFLNRDEPLHIEGCTTKFYGVQALVQSYETANDTLIATFRMNVVLNPSFILVPLMGLDRQRDHPANKRTEGAGFYSYWPTCNQNLWRCLYGHKIHYSEVDVAVDDLLHLSRGLKVRGWKLSF
jgi:hypothetical protein